MDEEIRTHHLPASHHSVVLRRVLWRSLGVMGVMVATLILMSSWRNGWSFSFDPVADVLPLVIVAVAVFVGGRRMAARVMSYQLTMGPNALRVTTLSTTPTEVLRSQVTRIEESPAGISVRSSALGVGIPREIEGYAEVRARLAEWAPIQQKSHTAANAATWAVMGAWVVVMFVKAVPAPVVAVVCVTATGLFGWSVAKVLRSQMEKRQKARLLLLTAVILIWSSMRIAGAFGWMP